MPDARAQLIVSVKDENSTANLAKIGKAGANMGTQLKQGLSGAISAATGFNVSTLGLVGGLTALGAGFAYSVKQADESQRVMTQTEAVIKSTGGAAGLTAVQIGSMADRLSQLNAVDDEVIQSAENLLLTFKAIKADAFEPATQAAIDLSVALKMDLNSAAMMIGKALEDPVRGMTALRRAGVTFTAEQQSVIKALVETGQAAKAQALILAELNSQVGGSAAAAAKTYSGQMALLKINIDNVAESIGMQILPALTAYASKMNEQVTVQNRYNTALANGALTEQDIKDIRFQNMFGLRDLALATLAAAEARYKEVEAIRAAGNAYDHMIPKVAAAEEQYVALTGAYDKMIGTAKRAEQATNESAAALLEAAGVYGMAEAAINRMNIGEQQRIEIEEQLQLLSGELTLGELARRDAVGYLTKQLEQGNITQQEYIDKINALASGSLNAAEAIYKTGAAIRSLPSDTYIRIHYQQYGSEDFGGAGETTPLPTPGSDLDPGIVPGGTGPQMPSAPARTSTGGNGVTINQYIHTTIPATDSSLLQTARAVSGAW